MRLTKEEILALANVLFFYKTHVDGNVSQLIAALITKLEDVLTDESEDDSSEEEADEDEDEEEDEMPDPDEVYDAKVYHALQPLKTSDGLLEFEEADGEISLILDGDPVSDNVSLVQRSGDKSLAVWCESGAGWDSYDVLRFPKSWKDKFEIGKVYGVA